MAQTFLWQEAPLRVTADGAWLHGDEPLHPRVQRLFARHLSWSPADGYRIVLRADSQPLEVADTPLHVIACHVVAGAQGQFVAAELTLSDGARQALDLGRLSQAADDVLYTQIHRAGAWLPCRFLPRAYYALALHLELDASGGVVVAGRPLALGRGRPPVVPMPAR